MTIEMRIYFTKSIYSCTTFFWTISGKKNYVRFLSSVELVSNVNFFCFLDFVSSKNQDQFFWCWRMSSFRYSEKGSWWNKNCYKTVNLLWINCQGKNSMAVNDYTTIFERWGKTFEELGRNCFRQLCLWWGNVGNDWIILNFYLTGKI